MGKTERNSVLKIAVITAAILLFTFAVAGTQIFFVFGITISSFMIAGGILLFIVAIELLTHGVWRFGTGIGTAGESGIVPLAFPLLAGPGAITSVIISFQTTGLIVTIISIGIVIGLTYLVLKLVNPIYKILGKRGSMIVTRVFAILIAADSNSIYCSGNQKFIFVELICCNHLKKDFNFFQINGRFFL